MGKHYGIAKERPKEIIDEFENVVSNKQKVLNYEILLPSICWEICRGRGACIKNSEIQTQMLK